MNVLLIQPRYNNDRLVYSETPSQALLVLGTLAQDRGNKVKILHLNVDRNPVEEEITAFKPDVLGITVNTFQVRSARLVAKLAREISRNIRIIIGGPHASVWDGEADEIVIGEGENRWLELLGEKPNVKTIDDLPKLNYDLIDLSKFYGIKPVGLVPSTSIMTSRGCPFDCTFCNTPIFWGKKVRYRSPELVLDEIQHLHSEYGIKEIFFTDDTFNLNYAWATEVFEGIIRNKLNNEMVFKITSRVNEKLLTKEFLDLAFKAGVWNIFYGIESGSQRMLDRMKKGTTVGEIKRALRMTREAHIASQASFIVGMPGETRDSLAETDKLINETCPNDFGWTFACPFPNTEFDREVTASGHKRDLDYADYRYGIIMVRTDELTFEDMKNFKGFSTSGYR